MFVLVCQTRINKNKNLHKRLAYGYESKTGPSKIPFRYLARLSHCSWISSWILGSKSRPPPFLAFDITFEIPIMFFQKSVTLICLFITCTSQDKQILRAWCTAPQIWFQRFVHQCMAMVEVHPLRIFKNYKRTTTIARKRCCRSF